MESRSPKLAEGIAETTAIHYNKSWLEALG
jgi:hypothetical protein